MTEPIPAPSSTRRFFGALLMGVGGLIAALCGGCGALFVIAGLVSSITSNPQDAPLFVGMGVVVGGVPAAIGVGLFFAGRGLRGEVARPTPKSIWPPTPPGADAP